MNNLCNSTHKTNMRNTGQLWNPRKFCFFPVLQIFLACRMNINTWDYDQAGITSRQTTWKHSWLIDLAGAVCISCPQMPALRWKCFDGIMWRINISRSGERHQRQTLGRLGLPGPWEEACHLRSPWGEVISDLPFLCPLDGTTIPLLLELPSSPSTRFMHQKILLLKEPVLLFCLLVLPWMLLFRPAFVCLHDEVF